MSENTSYRFQKGGNYPIALVVENHWGSKNCILVAYCRYALRHFCPNAFNPNTDPRNDRSNPQCDVFRLTLPGI
jgi:hypothetical protein